MLVLREIGHQALRRDFLAGRAVFRPHQSISLQIKHLSLYFKRGLAELFSFEHELQDGSRLGELLLELLHSAEGVHVIALLLATETIALAISHAEDLIGVRIGSGDERPISSAKGLANAVSLLRPVLVEIPGDAVALDQLVAELLVEQFDCASLVDIGRGAAVRSFEQIDDGFVLVVVEVILGKLSIELFQPSLANERKGDERSELDAHLCRG